jgi:hypothetical protein
MSGELKAGGGYQMFMSDWSAIMTLPEGYPGQNAYTFVIFILSLSLTSVSIFSVCCCCRYVSLWTEQSTGLVKGKREQGAQEGCYKRGRWKKVMIKIYTYPWQTIYYNSRGGGPGGNYGWMRGSGGRGGRGRGRGSGRGKN